MSVSVRGGGAISKANSATGVITLSSASQTGDGVLLHITADNPLASVTFTPPADQTWVLLEGYDFTSGDTQCCATYYCKSLSSGASTYTIGVTGSWNDLWSAAMVVFYGHDTTTPIASGQWAGATQSSNASITSSTVTTTRDGCLIIWGFSADADSQSYTVTSPTGFDAAIVPVASNMAQPCALATKSQATAGATGSLVGSSTYTGGYGDNSIRAYTIAIQPSAGGTGASIAAKASAALAAHNNPTMGVLRQMRSIAAFVGRNSAKSTVTIIGKAELAALGRNAPQSAVTVAGKALTSEAAKQIGAGKVSLAAKSVTSESSALRPLSAQTAQGKSVAACADSISPRCSTAIVGKAAAAIESRLTGSAAVSCTARSAAPVVAKGVPYSSLAIAVRGMALCSEVIKANALSSVALVCRSVAPAVDSRSGRIGVSLPGKCVTSEASNAVHRAAVSAIGRAETVQEAKALSNSAASVRGSSNSGTVARLSPRASVSIAGRCVVGAEQSAVVRVSVAQVARSVAANLAQGTPTSNTTLLCRARTGASSVARAYGRETVAIGVRAVSASEAHGIAESVVMLPVRGMATTPSVAFGVPVIRVSVRGAATAVALNLANAKCFVTLSGWAICSVLERAFPLNLAIVERQTPKSRTAIVPTDVRIITVPTDVRIITVPTEEGVSMRDHIAHLEKHAVAVLDYKFIWSNWLVGREGERIETATFSIEGGDVALAIDSQLFDQTSATVWLSGGTPNTRYEVKCMVETTAGRNDWRSIVVEVEC